jgi:hypothetical protein
MRRAIATGIVAAFLAMPGAVAAEPMAVSVDGAPLSLSQMAPRPWHDAGVDSLRVVAIAAGTVVGVVAANYLTGGMITPLLAFGTTAPAAAAAPAATGIGLGMGSLMVAAPAAMASMGVMTPLLGAAAPSVAATAGAGAATAGAAGASSLGGTSLGVGLGMGAEMSVMVADRRLWRVSESPSIGRSATAIPHLRCSSRLSARAQTGRAP